MKAILALWDRLLDLAGVLAAVLTALMTLSVCADIVLRTIDGHGVEWAFDFVEYGLLALAALSIPYVMRLDRHIYVDVFRSIMSPSVQRAVRALNGVAVVIIGAVLAVAAVSAAVVSYREGSLLFRTVIVPEWIPFALVALMFLLVTGEAIRKAFERWRDLRGEEVAERTDVF